MILGSPDETPYDLRFRLLGIPVRVHPLFWLVMLLLGSGSGRIDLTSAAVFIVVAFVSVLVHEMGHGVASRAVGNEPIGIVLYAMGGFCQFEARRQTTGERLFVLLMGPGAGFALLGLVLAFLNARYKIQPLDALALIGVDHVLSYLGARSGSAMTAVMQLGMFHGSAHFQAIYALLYINLWWGVFNLFPIWPLDGGQATGVVLGEVNPRDGMRWCHIVSIVTATGLAYYKVTHDNPRSALWIAYFALINLQMLRSLIETQRFSDDSDWWRR